jgi:Putative auto-transporter adhesin, head GIN domain
MKNGIQTFATILAGFIILFSMSSCLNKVEGIGPVVNHNREIKGFNALELQIPCNVTLVISDEVKCVVSAQSNINEVIDIKNDGERLIIESKKNIQPTKPVEITLSTAALKELRIDGSGDIKVINPIKGDDIQANVNGSGDIEMPVDVNQVRTKINGSGDITVTGRAEYHKIQINGSGSVLAFGLNADKCRIKINGSGEVEQTCGSNLEINIVGSGTVKYKGSPAIKSDVTGSGEVRKEN